MRKALLSGIVASVLLLSACGTPAAQSAQAPASEGIPNNGVYFDVDMDTLIPLVNQAASDSKIPEIAYESGDKESRINGNGLTMKTNYFGTSNKPKSIGLYVYLDSGVENISYFGFYVGLLSGTLDPEGADAMSAAVQAAVNAGPQTYDINTVDGTTTKMELITMGGGLTVTISPLEE